ncbi:MAG: COQ9 family protein, partial [Rhodovarius sp.]|nr:COQ9 family protein [Rhodovarius sp.]
MSAAAIGTAEEAAILQRLLPLVPRLGWTQAALIRAAGDAALAENAFPRGPRDAIAAWVRQVDAEMERAAAAEGLSGLPTPKRIRWLILWRLAHVAPHKEALRQAMALLALPWNAPLAVRLTAGSVNAMWYAAGDRSADFSWYTRRATLAAIYTATVAFWLTDSSADLAPTAAFLDRRLE